MLHASRIEKSNPSEVAMIVTAHAHEIEANAALFDQMYQLRARQFKDRRNWRVDVVNGQERDIFDQLNPLYVCVIDEDRRLLASLRLLPTTGSHMLSDVFPEVMGNIGIVRNPLVVESSRFCVDTSAVKNVGASGINDITRELLWGLFHTAQTSGMTHVISVYDVFMERILRRSGCPFERLGPIVKYDGLKTVGGMCEASDDVLNALSPQKQKTVAAA
ncbi:acyl-homoserine-lactone synthase [Cognatiyoonia sp. IB215182]|uniref:acyl-homoserine-lactone synthase n=1 Tax=Cognatiyoonia sp. IB215182 TaxID=3097353 RepID=UPI002A0BABA4|nr:acyl-homoserine-lactone synthase [Cognatiyoonia sp. IB215182]MDX8355494.1 acyl-homoserine-lactone synthase [Cognatiyoonia sp. IB215182]